MNFPFGSCFRLRPKVAIAKDSSVCECKLYLLMAVRICKSQMFWHHHLCAASLDVGATEWKF